MSLEELRSYRIQEIAIFDVIIAILAIEIILYLMQVHATGLSILLVFPLGIITHYILGIDTTLNYKLGLSDKP